MKKLFYIFAVLLLTGCLAVSGTAPVTSPNIGQAQPLLSTRDWDFPYAEHTQIAASGANDFAFRLSAAIAQSAGYDSFVVSPFSVWMPLAALVNATEGEHREDLLKVLGATGLDADDINRAASRMLYDLTNEAERDTDWYRGNPLRIANAIFVDYEWPLRVDFAQRFLDYFRGDIMNVDFLSQDAVDAVNQWAYDNTEGLISDLVQEFESDTAAVIANAIYFASRWTQEFDPEETSEGVFYSPSGEVSAYFMLREGLFLPYFEDEYVQATEFYFSARGGMTIILPRSGDAVGLLSEMTAERFEEITMSPREGRILLPRFSIATTIDDLPDILAGMGVTLFDEVAAPLTGGLLETSLPVWLSDAIQKAMIEVDEEGTTAAAVTLMMAMAAGAPFAEDDEPFEMICDSPFAFILWGFTHDGGRQVLFTGVVNQP